MAQAYRTLVRDDSGKLRVVLREVGSDVVVTDPSGYTIVKLDEGQNPIPVNYWLDRPQEISNQLPIPGGLTPNPNTQPGFGMSPGEDNGEVQEDIWYNRGAGQSDTPTPVEQNAYNKDGTPNRFGEGIIDRGRGFMTAAAGAAIGTAVGGPIGGLIGGLAGRAANRTLDGRLGDRLSPAGQLYGWGIGQPRPEAVIAEIDKSRATPFSPAPQAPSVQSSRPASQPTQNAPLSPVTSAPLGAIPAGTAQARSTMPTYDSLMNTPVNPASGARPTQVSSPTANISSPQSISSIPGSGKANISYAELEWEGKERPHRPDLETVDRVRSAIGEALPGYSINVTSGLGEFGSNRHRAMNGGRAFDYNLVDPNGQKVTPATDRNAFNVAAEAMASYGIKGIGHYGWGMHADTVKQNSWGPTEGLASLHPSFGNAIERGRANPVNYSYSGPPTPTTRPDPSIQQTSQAIANSAVPSQPGGRANFNEMSIGEIAFSGFGRQPDDTQISAMANIMAGELDGRTLRGLQNGDPEARREAANMIATMENRIQSVGFGNVTNPSQYNSLMGSARAVTDANYRQFGDVISSTIRDTYAGRNAPSNPNATHYANMSIANPSWAGSMTNTQRVGPHTFGTIPGEYQPTKDRLAEARQAAEASRRAYEDARATPAQDTSPRTSSVNPSSGVSPGGFASLSISGGIAGRTEADSRREAQRERESERTEADRAESSGRDSKDSGRGSSSNTGSNSGSGGNGRDVTPDGRSSSSSSSRNSGGGFAGKSSGGNSSNSASSARSSSDSGSSKSSGKGSDDKDSKSGKK